MNLLIRLWKRWLAFQWRTSAPALAKPFESSDITEMDWQDPFPEPVEWEITDTLDLHTIPPRQVKTIVEEYLFQAHQRGFKVVRLIHGKGIGVQRATVRNIMSRTPIVREFYDAPDASGWGATVAHLQIEPQISESVSGQLE